MSNTLFGLAFDVADAADQAAFWAQATGGKVGLGASKLNELNPGGARWTTLADPEGNEFDVIVG